MGAYDTVKEVLSRVGTVQFDKVAMRPGMPQGFGVLGEEQVPVVHPARATRSARSSRSTSSSRPPCGAMAGRARSRPARRATVADGAPRR